MSASVHGSVRLVVLGVLDELLVVGVARFRVVVRLKYHEGAVKVIELCWVLLRCELRVRGIPGDRESRGFLRGFRAQ